jgi:hypothetical protein
VRPSRKNARLVPVCFSVPHACDTDGPDWSRRTSQLIPCRRRSPAVVTPPLPEERRTLCRCPHTDPWLQEARVQIPVGLSPLTPRCLRHGAQVDSALRLWAGPVGVPRLRCLSSSCRENSSVRCTPQWGQTVGPTETDFQWKQGAVEDEFLEGPQYIVAESRQFLFVHFLRQH